MSGEWTMAFEGLSPSFAAAIGGVMLLLVALAYAKGVKGVSAGKRVAMAWLRSLGVVLLLWLLMKPVIWKPVSEKVREPLLVLVDGSESMQMVDRRDRPEDMQRWGIASGQLAPNAEAAERGDLRHLNAEQASMSRAELLRVLAGNERLRLWQRLAEVADLKFYGFGSKAERWSLPGGLGGSERSAAELSVKQWGDWFEAEGAKLKLASGAETAMGDALLQVLQEPRVQSEVSVLLITDGGQNAGSSAMEAAQVAREQGVKLWIYGVGVTQPMDVQVAELRVPKLSFIRERAQVSARIRAQSLPEQSLRVKLMADGEPLEEKEITLGGDDETVVKFDHVPHKAGEVRLEVAVDVLPGESSEANNIAGGTMRVTDSKFRVLLIEQEPRWDFRYLLDYLQRDPRLEVKCVMIDGEPGLEQVKDFPFLARLPEDREAYFQSHVIILGDVDPRDLGMQRMEWLAEWVESGGGIIFLTGSNHNPRSYVGTPLEELLPVVPDTVMSLEGVKKRALEPFKLELTPQGRESPYLQMDSDEEKNVELWEGFEGVRWTAPVARVKASAEVLLVDSREERSGRYGKSPVFAMQGYGAGRCVYFGTDETWRWRSRTGEKHYSQLWGQIMQTLSLQLMEGASPLTQLKTERAQYRVGERVVISGKVYEQGFAPWIQPSLEGALTLEGDEQFRESLTLRMLEANFYQGEWLAKRPGIYRFVTERDADGVVEFEVVDQSPERAQVGMNENLLRGMAEISGGRFLREENLDELPEKITGQSLEVASLKKMELYHSGWLMLGLLGLWFGEWWLRRWNRLK